MNKEDHFIDTDKLGDVLLEFSKKISRFSQNIPDTLFGSLTEFLKNIPDDVKNTQLFANVQKLSNYDLNYEDVWWLVDSYGLIDKEDAEEELMEYYEQRKSQQANAANMGNGNTRQAVDFYYQADSESTD